MALSGSIMLLRATLRSLGVFGIILAVAFFGLLMWLVVSLPGLLTRTRRAVNYVIELMLITVLSAGVSWSHVRRRLTGQVGTDEVDN